MSRRAREIVALEGRSAFSESDMVFARELWYLVAPGRARAALAKMQSYVIRSSRSCSHDMLRITSATRGVLRACACEQICLPQNLEFGVAQIPTGSS